MSLMECRLKYFFFCLLFDVITMFLITVRVTNLCYIFFCSFTFYSELRTLSDHRCQERLFFQ